MLQEGKVVYADNYIALNRIYTRSQLNIFFKKYNSKNKLGVDKIF